MLFGYRQQLIDLAGRLSRFGVHPSTYYAWKRRVERHGLEILRPRERRAPRMPNQLSPLVQQLELGKRHSRHRDDAQPTSPSPVRCSSAARLGC